jgi:hypothetical protein
MCLSETYSKVRVGERFSDKFSVQNDLKQGYNLSPLFFDFASDYAVRMSIWTHQLLVYADDVNLLGDSLNTMKGNTEPT